MRLPLRDGTCEPCGKGLWRSRKAARTAARSIHPGAPLHVYQCPHGMPGYHYGHLPAAVVHGRITRDVAYPHERTA